MYPTSIPTSFRAGDSVTWDTTLDDYLPSDSWVLKFEIVGAGRITITSTGTASVFTSAISTTESAALPKGIYAYQAHVSKGTEDITVDVGTLEVLENLRAVVAGYEARSMARQALDAVEAALIGRASKAQSDIVVNGKQVRYMTLQEMLRARATLKLEVARDLKAEAIARGEEIGGQINVRFLR